MRRLISLILALAAVTILAGCGGSGSVSQDDFERDVVAARDQVDGALAHITDNPSGKEELLDRMDEAAAQIDRTAEELDEREAPEGLDDERTKLVRAFRQLAVDLSQTAEQIRQPDFSGLLEGTQGLSFQSWVDANEVLRELREQGLDVRPLGRH
jgi:predicted small lipoprotein YifL